MPNPDPSPQAVAVIPTRLGSTRFPRKVLADKTGKYLTEHVVEQARKARLIRHVAVAVDDRLVRRKLEERNIPCVSTRTDHTNGTSRIAEAIEKDDQLKNADIIVNVQGDEPEIDPAAIDLLVQRMLDDPAIEMATLYSTFADDEDPADPNIVKVVPSKDSFALYFSRSLIPYNRDQREGVDYWKHPGLYAYRRSFLMRYVTLAPTPAEQTEQLEQLRALEHACRIALVRFDATHHGIDTPEQYDAFVARHNASTP